MARRRSNFSYRGSAAPRRQTEWLSLPAPTGVNTLAAGNKIIAAQMDAVEKAKLPFTITRTIGLLTCLSDQVVAREVPMGTLGATVVTDRAVTVGITAMPDPVTESNADYWFLFQPWSVIMQIGGAGEVGASHSAQLFFDSKAQRKVEEGEDIVFILANADTASGIFFQLQFRMLIKLH